MTDDHKPKTPASNLKAIDKFKKQHAQNIGLQFNIDYDADILAKLDSVPSKRGYIKELIRRDIRENG